MKKCFLFLCLCLVTLSCSKDKNDAISTEGLSEAEIVTKLVGTWQLQSRMIDGEPYALDDCDKQSIIVISFSNILDFNHKVYEVNPNIEGGCRLDLDDTGGTMSFTYGTEEKKPIDGKIWLNYPSRYASGGYAYEVSDTTLKLGSIEPANGERSKTYVKQ